MKQIIPSLILLMCITTAYSQQDSMLWQAKIDSMEIRIREMETNFQKQLNSKSRDIRKLDNKLSASDTRIQDQYELHDSKIDSLQQLINQNRDSIAKTANELEIKIDVGNKKTTEELSGLNELLVSRTNIWIISLALALIISIVIFFVLKKQLSSQKSALIDDLTKTRKSIETEGIKLDNKLIEVLESQLKLMEQKSLESADEIDHSLVLKIADEIIRIQKNLGNMDPDIKGWKQLNGSVKRMLDNFASNGYEIVDMLGKTYNEGMKVVANFIPDESLPEGEEKITRIIKPQVNFKGTMIQSAQIEVSLGE